MSAAAMAARTRDMLQAPVLPTLLRLATPNVIGLFATTVSIGYDGYIIGRLGADALAEVALVFPLSMLMLQMSAGGIGGGAKQGMDAESQYKRAYTNCMRGRGHNIVN